MQWRLPASRNQSILSSIQIAVLGWGGLFAPSLHAQDILHTAATAFVEPEDQFKRVGIEMEMSGLSFEQLERLLRTRFKIERVEKVSDLETHLHIAEGPIKLKIEGQAWRYEFEPEKYAAQILEDIKVAPREIVFPPLSYQKAMVLGPFSLDLKKAGALGTTPDRAVAFQVNYEFGPLREDLRRVRDLVDVLRTYYDTDNMRQIDAVLDVPSSRREFLNDITPGFRKKLFNPAYNPDLEEFFVDYLYRQSAELFGFKDAWTASFENVGAFLFRLKDPVHPTVLKMQRVRISSLLLEAFPEDPLVKEVIKSRWAVAAPIIEFREFNMIFENVDSDIRSCLGLVSSVKKYGYYKHDVLMSALTGIPQADFPRIRKAAATNKPFILRYWLQDPKTAPALVKGKERSAPGSKALWTSLNPDHPGKIPLNVSGESIVFHRRNIHRTSIIGKYNPGLDNGFIQQVLENKLTEAKLFDAYARGSMPRFASLKSVLKSEKLTPEAVFQAASKEFPKGWVMKGSWDLGSEKSFISNQINIEKEIAAYKNGFEAHRAQVLAKEVGADPEYIGKRLKEHPGYQGWKIVSMLENPNHVFFQEMIPIDREFRVEVLNGKVVHGATIDRYAYLHTDTKQPLISELDAIERYTQGILDQLPNELRYLPYGLDVARLTTGGFKIIETNPGGNSSFLEESIPSVQAYEKALRAYAADARSGQLVKRLDAREEMAWIKDRFKEFKISSARDYPGMIFMGNGIFDPEYTPKLDCRELFRPNRYIPYF